MEGSETEKEEVEYVNIPIRKSLYGLIEKVVGKMPGVFEDEKFFIVKIVPLFKAIFNG